VLAQIHKLRLLFCARSARFGQTAQIHGITSGQSRATILNPPTTDQQDHHTHVNLLLSTPQYFINSHQMGDESFIQPALMTPEPTQPMEDVIHVMTEASADSPPVLSSIIPRLSPLSSPTFLSTSANLFEMDTDNGPHNDQHNLSRNLENVAHDASTMVHPTR